MGKQIHGDLLSKNFVFDNSLEKTTKSLIFIMQVINISVNLLTSVGLNKMKSEWFN